jgi:hypothetical protein
MRFATMSGLNTYKGRKIIDDSKGGYRLFNAWPHTETAGYLSDLSDLAVDRLTGGFGNAMSRISSQLTRLADDR